MENKSGEEGHTSKIPPINLFYRAMRITTFLLFVCSFYALADNTNSQATKAIDSVQQDINKTQVTGVVLDVTGEPIIGASVKVQGSTTGTITNLDGEFKLEIPRKGIIEVSYIGYRKQEIAIGKERNLRIVMEEDTKALDEVIVIGYGTTSKRKTTAAISNVNAEEIAKTPTANITQSLAGRAPGLIVTTSGGGIGNFSNISIRGGGTPLYVIDDVVSEARDFQNINPEDIDQITVLKDASATAVYGARAANGIIMVVTKQGKAGKMSISYNANFNFSQPAYLPEKLDSYDVMYYTNMGRTNDGAAPNYEQKEMDKYRTINGWGKDDDGNNKYYGSTDWQDVTTRKFAPEQRHTLSLTGGSEKLKVFTGVGYYEQGSLYVGNANNLKRYNMRTNLVSDFKEIGLKVVAGFEGYISKIRSPQGNYSTTWSHIQNKSPLEAAYNQYGQVYSGTTDNPLVDISPDGGYTQTDISTVRANLLLEWAVPFVPGLKFKALGNYTAVNDREKTWNKKITSYDNNGDPNNPGKPSLSKGTWFREQYTTQFFADYNQTFNKVHTVGALFGMEASGSNYDNISISRKDYLLDIDQIGAGPTDGWSNSSSEGISSRRAALIARLKYDYASKYIVDASMRYDGSDYFPKGKRWGTFFSGSLAWVLSEEAFWTNLKDKHIFDQFKIRGSYGEVGQDGSEGRLARYAYLKSNGLNQRGFYDGSSFLPVFSEGAMVSPDISWYTSKSMNIGIDFGSLNNRLSGSIDYFRMVTTGYLASASSTLYDTALAINLPSVLSNGESIRQGAEFILQWKEKRGDFNYSVSTNLTFYDSFWNINPDEKEAALKNPYTRTTQVHNYASVSYKNLGYYTSFDDVMNSPKRTASTNLVAGDLKYADFNGDGVIDGNDQYYNTKSSSPRANYGISLDMDYKGWFMNMLWQGATSAEMQLASILQGGNSVYAPLIYEFQTDVWTADNRNSLYPRLHQSASYNGNNNFVSSDFWYVNTKYLRLKTLTVGYDFKNRLLKRVAWLSKCSLALSGYNLLTFSPAKKYGMDPEVGTGDFYTYPVSRVYAVSLNIGF